MHRMISSFFVFKTDYVIASSDGNGTSALQLDCRTAGTNFYEFMFLMS
jgi:hypothetical protein